MLVYLHEGHREVRGTYSFECSRCNSAGRTRNAVSWKLGQRVFGLDRDSGKGRRTKENTWIRLHREKDIVPLGTIERKKGNRQSKYM